MNAQKAGRKLSETPKIHVKLQKGLKVAVDYGKMYIRHMGGYADFAQPAPLPPLYSTIHKNSTASMQIS